MKAKEAAQRLLDCYNDRDRTAVVLEEVLKQFFLEAQDLVQKRHCQTDAACIAVMDEQSRKWQAVANRVAGLDPEGFAIYVAILSPELAEQWEPGRRALQRVTQHSDQGQSYDPR